MTSLSNYCLCQALLLMYYALSSMRYEIVLCVCILLLYRAVSLQFIMRGNSESVVCNCGMNQ